MFCVGVCETNFFFNHLLLIHSKKNDPSTGVWTITGNMNIDYHTSSLLMDGEVLVLGEQVSHRF